MNGSTPRCLVWGHHSFLPPTRYAYDAASNLTSMTDRKGQVHTYAYDAANRLTSVTAGGQTISYTYNANGNRLTMVDPTGTTSYLYDSLDRQTRVTYPDAKTVQAAYDKNSNRTSLTNPGAVATTATYDAANRLTQMTQGTLTWTFGYDAAGNRTSLSHPNGTSIAYAYLNNHWLSSVTHKKGATTLQSFAYTYDALNRLTQATYPGTYGTYTWTYDAVGNRLTQTGPGGTTNYAYDANSRLTQAGSTTYSYDANGNLTSISTGRTFTWDVFNRMTATTASGSTVTHTYNGDGLKTRRVGPNGTTNYYHDGIRPIWETNSAGAMTAQYDRDIFGNLLSRLESGTRRYYHHDGLGSTTAITDAAGAVSATMLYDAWGDVRTNSGSTQGNYRFTGAERDVTTGLYHMGARFYDPSIGRWLSEDPVQDQHFNPLALNYYAYVWSAPTGLVDHNGLFPSPAQLILGNSVHAAVGRWFEANFPGGHANLTIKGFGLRLDMMKPGPSGVWEVYELKSAATLRDPGKRAKAVAQLQGYVNALGKNAQAGGSWNPQGQVVPWNSMFNAVLTSDPTAPGIIGYSLSPTNNAISVLVSVYGVDPTIAAAVLAILLAAAAAGSQSPLFNPVPP